MTENTKEKLISYSFFASLITTVILVIAVIVEAFLPPDARFHADFVAGASLVSVFLTFGLAAGYMSSQSTKPRK